VIEIRDTPSLRCHCSICQQVILTKKHIRAGLRPVDYVHAYHVSCFQREFRAILSKIQTQRRALSELQTQIDALHGQLKHLSVEVKGR
jgi:hypothetical protein